MSVESCAMIFVQHAKSYGIFPLDSRLRQQPPLGSGLVEHVDPVYVQNVWLEAQSLGQRQRIRVSER